MIFTDRIITVRKGESKINEPIIVYRGDYELEVRFTIMNSKFKFMSGTNLIESENAAYGQLAILTPYGGNIFSDVAKCNEGTVTFVLTKAMLDQIEEVGLYSFQIRLFDYNKESRVSIPPVEFGIEVREPITSEDHDNSVNNAIVGYSIAKIADALNENVPDTFNSNGDYNKTIWETGDRITEGKLNKIEDALDKINQNKKTLDKKINSNFNVLDYTKADKNEVFTMANMGQDIREAMTGGSVAVVGEGAILEDNILDEQVTGRKIVKQSISNEHIRKIGRSDILNSITYAYTNQYIADNFNLSSMQGWYVSDPVYIPEGTLPVAVVDNESWVPGIWVDSQNNFTENPRKIDTIDNGNGYYTVTLSRSLSNSTHFMFNYCAKNIAAIIVDYMGSIETEHIRDGAITDAKLAPDLVITGERLINSSVTGDKLASKHNEDILASYDFLYENKYYSGNGKLESLNNWYVLEPIRMEHDSVIDIIINVNSGYIPGIWVDANLVYVEPAVTTDYMVQEDGLYMTHIEQPNNSGSKYLLLNYSSDNISEICLWRQGCIDTQHLKDGVVTLDKLADDFIIKTGDLENGCVTSEKIAGSGGQIDILSLPKERENYYINNNNYTSMTSGGWYVTAPIHVLGDTIIMTSTQSPALLGCAYDANDDFISNIAYTIQKSGDEYITTIDCSNYTYIRMNIWDKVISCVQVLHDGAITSDHLQDGCITPAKISYETLTMLQSASGSRYIDLYYTRTCIADFLDKWQEKEMLNIVCIGDSITNFQNSETLDVASQKNAPLGLQGNSWVRRLWKILNYDVYNDDRTIKSENGNLVYKRYDHADFTFDGGYQGTAASVGSYKWATNRSDSADSWRNVNYGGYNQVITSESTSNKMMVGSIATNASCSVTIPANAIGMAIVFGGCVGRVNVKIKEGSTTISNTDVALTGAAFEFHKEFALTSGNIKTVTITLVSGTVWLYGIETWSANCVRVINSGLAGNTVGSVNSNFTKLFSGFDGDINNVDLVVWEVNALNDARELLTSTRTNAKAVFNNLNNHNIPILAIMTHRHQTGNDALQYDRFNPIYGSTLPRGSALVGNKTFYPDYIKLYKTLAHKYNAGIIDMFSKSVDICGGLSNNATFPSGFFVDGIHLGVVGNQCYEEELRKVFMWDDYE